MSTRYVYYIEKIPSLVINDYAGFNIHVIVALRKVLK
jgi:hypothetical protein